MTAARPLALVVPTALLVLVTGCGGSLATQPSSRPAVTTKARASSPFCEAVQASRDAAVPVSGIGLSGTVGDIARVAATVRQADQQVSQLAPQEIRTDVDRANRLVERQLELLEANGGDALAMSRDPEITEARTDPAYREASQRINDYVRSSCVP